MITGKDIEHTFYKRAHDLISLFKGTNKLSSFMYKLEKQSNIDPIKYNRDEYVGDGFEFLIELLIKSSPIDNRIGITNYTPVQINDTGVDGTGLNISNDRCVVQIKYRSNTTQLLTANADHLSNMFSAAQTKYNINTVSSDKVMVDNLFKDGLIDVKNYQIKIKSLETSASRYYIFTTAKDLHYYTDSEMYGGMVHCIGYDKLKQLLDGNISFWSMCERVSQELNVKPIHINIKDIKNPTIC